MARQHNKRKSNRIQKCCIRNNQFFNIVKITGIMGYCVMGGISCVCYMGYPVSCEMANMMYILCFAPAGLYFYQI